MDISECLEDKVEGVCIRQQKGYRSEILFGVSENNRLNAAECLHKDSICLLKLIYILTFWFNNLLILQGTDFDQ